MPRKKRLLFILPVLIFTLFLSIHMVNQIFDYQESKEIDDYFNNHEEVKMENNAIDIENEPEKDEEPETTTSQEELKKIMVEVENENSKRLEKIEAVCRKYNLGLYKNSQQPSPIKHPPTPQYSVFYFDRINKWSLCPIYKAGSSTWLHNMLLLGGMTETEISTSGRQLSDLARSLYPELDPSTAEQEFQISTKILTVRHPFERVLSAYRDKLENINWGGEHGSIHFYKAYGSKIVKKYRPGANKTKTLDLIKPGEYLWNPQHPTPAGVEPTFQEFARFLIDSNLVSKSDDHWIPYYLFCTPCLLHYDFIAKIETFERDQTYIIRSLGLHNQIKARWSHKTQFTDNDESDAISTAAKVYFKQLTSAQILQLFEKYRIDFELFGYNIQPYLKIAKDAPTNR